MTRAELMHELDRIIDVGIVNAHHDKKVLENVRDLVNALVDDVSKIRSCRTCRFADLDHCSPDANVDSDAFRRWRGCEGSMKLNWKWRLEDDDDG